MSFSGNDRLIKGIAFEKAVIEVLKEDNKFLVTDYDLHDVKYKFSQYNDYDKMRINEFRHNQNRFDAYASNVLNLSCFEMGVIRSKRIFILIKESRNTIYFIDELLHLDADVTLDEETCIILILSNSIKDTYKQRIIAGSKCRWIFIEQKILLRNTIIKNVLKRFDEYIIEKDNVLIKDYYSNISKLNNKYSFALGAGCSVNSNISDWNSLSEALGYELLYNLVDDKDSAYKNMHITNEINNKIFNCYEKNSALDAIYVSYMSSPSVKKNDYYDAIKKVLYMSYDSPNDANKALMTSINKCIKRNNIKEIMTYNFDSVLEQNYDNSYKSKANEIANAQTRIGSCTVYHVHGYIPYDYNGKTEVKSFIFTDGEYYDNMMNPDSNCNTIQSKLLENYNVIFVGVSFVDSNMKERLRIRKMKGCTNEIFAFLKLPEFEGKGTEIKIMESKYKLIQQNYFDTLGVKILWVKDFNEIPTRIDSF